MAAVLSRNRSDIEKLSGFIDECKKMHIPVKGPDVNESFAEFGVNAKGDIRFGLAALKGIGENVVSEILAARNKGGAFESVYDFVERVNPSVLNRRIIDTLAMAGAFDCFSSAIQREDFFETNNKGETFSESLLRYGQLYQADQMNSAMSLFGDDDAAMSTAGRPQVIPGLRWVDAVRLEKEREIVGTYHSANPLDPYFMELRFGTTTLKSYAEREPVEGVELALGGMVLDFTSRPAKNGGNYGILKIQDYTGSAEFMLFGQDYINFHNYGVPGTPLFIRGVYGRRFQNSDIRFKITSIRLLSELKGQLVSGITIHVAADKLNEALHGVLVEHARSASTEMGNLRFRVTDPATNRHVNLDTSVRIPVNKELVEKLENLEVEFTVERT